MADSDDDDIVEDEGMAADEAETRGRKRKRERSVNPSDYNMDVDDEEGEESKTGQKKRSMTPA